MSYETKVEKVDIDLIIKNKIKLLKQKKAIQQGADLLAGGELVAFPTETVYGLGADATNGDAVKKIFQAKGRPQDNPLIVHIASKEQLESVIDEEISVIAEKLIDAFWPGPLTIIFPKNQIIPDQTTASLSSVAVRMPSHPVARALIELSNLPVAAPSANSSGFPSPTQAGHVYNDLKGKIPYIIDGGNCQVGLESTVIDIRGECPVILRPGGITREKISRVLGFEIYNRGQGRKNSSKLELETPPSPGMKYRHYSPVTPLKLLSNDQLDRINELLTKYNNKRVVLVVTEETKLKFNNLPDIKIVQMGSQDNLEEIAQNIFAILRDLDRKNIDLILMETVPEKGIGEAIMNRLHKAASNDIYF